jgi:hypothetical protein
MASRAISELPREQAELMVAMFLSVDRDRFDLSIVKNKSDTIERGRIWTHRRPLENSLTSYVKRVKVDPGFLSALCREAETTIQPWFV